MRFLFTCGGTAGHINPALAVAGRLKELHPDAQFLFIGVEGKMEMQLVPLAGYEIRGLNMTYIRRGHDLQALRYNMETLKNVARSTRQAREIIREFGPLQIPTGSGNVIFPSGNALKYLREYFDENVAESSPYDEDPGDVRCLSFSANGDVLNGNIYRTDILEIIRTYRP